MSSYVDYASWLLIDPEKFKIIKNKEIDKILFVLINESSGNVGGDFCSLGVAEYFKKVYPNIGLTILSDKKTLERFGKVSGIEMLEYKDKSTIDEIKNKGFKAGIFISLDGLNLSNFKFLKYKVSPFYPSAGSLLHWKNRIGFTRRAFIPWGTHMVNICFKLFELLGFRFKEKDILFYYSKEDERNTERFIKKNKLKKFVVMHPGGKHVVETLKRGKWPPHLWPLERYAEVADYLKERGFDVVITGIKEEKELADKIKEKSKARIIDCCGKLSIREVGALLKRSKMLITTDTSILHVAYEVKIPIIELFGPSCPEVSGAWPLNSKKHILLVDNGSCSRSMRKLECPEGIICMANIKSEDVKRAIDRLL